MSVLVGLHGGAGSGKDTVAKLIIDWCNDMYPTCLPRRYSFAKPVYELASVILGVTPEFLGRYVCQFHQSRVFGGEIGG